VPIIKEFLKERSPITSLKSLNNNTLSYSTKYSGAKLLDSQELITKTRIICKELNAETTAVCFSPDANYMAFANANVINILDVHTKKIFKSIKTLLEKIELLTFCPNSTYLIAGSHSGRVYQYRYDSSALLARLCSFAPLKKSKSSFISSLAVHKNSLACSGSGGAIYLIDLLSQTQRISLVEKGERVNALCFMDENTLISANISGKILIHSLNSQEKAKGVDAPFSDIKRIIKMPNPNYVMISSSANYVAIVDVKKAKITHAKYAEFESEVVDITLASDESVLVALQNYKIINLVLASKSKLKSFIMHNSLYEAYNLVENEPMLQDSVEYKLLEKRYQSIYKDTLHALMNQNKNLALGIIDILKGVRSKEQDISALFLAFENYNRFKVLYLEKKYSLAYAMCKKYPALAQTPLYLKLEENFKESFVNAHRHIKLEKDEHAVSLMNEYITVASKRHIIKLLLNRDIRFLTFLQAIEEKDFQTIEELKYINEIFSQAPTYVALSKSIKKTVTKIDTLIAQGELTKAKELLSTFKNSSHVNIELKRIHQNLESMQKLLNAYALNDFKSCYEILDSYPQLNSTQLGVLLNRHWAKVIDESEEYALRGDARGVKKTLNSLISVSTRKNRIGDLLRVSFHSKIKGSLANKNFKNAENIIYSYIDIFGTDNEIKSLMNSYEVMSKRVLAITQDQNQRVDRDKWMESEIIKEMDS